MTTLRHSAVRALALACAFVVLNAATASATHLMGGTIYWEKDLTFVSATQDRVIVTFEGSFQRDTFPWTPTNPTTGQTITSPIYQLSVIGNGFSQFVNLPLLVVAHSVSGNWFTGRYTFALTLNKTVFPVELEFNVGDRDDVLRDGNANKFEIITSVVDLTKGTRSPRWTGVPRITVQQNTTFTVSVPSVAFDGFTNTYRFATATESALQTPIPNGTPACQPGSGGTVPFQCTTIPPGVGGSMTLTPTGFMTWTPQLTGLYAVQVIITSVDSAQNKKNFTPVDVMFEVVAPCNPALPTCNVPPMFTPPAPNVTAHVNQPVNFTVTATDSATDRVTAIANTPLPAGATITVTPSPANGAPATAAFHWTPTLAQMGPTFVCFQASDTQGLTSVGNFCATVTVVDDPPSIICPAPINVIAAPGSFTADAPIAVTINAPEATTHTITFKVGGTTFATQAITGPLGPEVRTATATGLAIGGHSVTVSLTDGVAGASCTTSVTVDRLPQTISFPAIADQIYGGPNVILGATTTSGLTVSYEVLSGPGTLPGGPTDPTLTISATGLVEVKATQGGDAHYAPADPQVIVIHVLNAPTSIALAGLGSFPYNGGTHSAAAAVNGPYGPLPFTATITYNGLSTAPTAAGHYEVHAAYGGDSNYAGSSADGAIDITAVGLIVTANPASRGYGAVDPAFTVSYSGFVPGDSPASLGGTLTFSTAPATSGVGAYPIVPGGLTSSNYAIAFQPGTLTITAVPLVVTANDATKPAGEANPAFTASFSGLVNGDTAAGIGAALIFTTTATAASPQGTYPISVSNVTSLNYVPSYMPGTLTITEPLVCLSPDALKEAKSGSTIPVRIAVCGGSTQAGVSLEAVSVTAIGGGPALPAQDAGNANPGGVFRLTGQGYMFNLQTTGLAPGVYLLNYQIAGNALIRSVPFTVR